jgi:hypothetical protein
MRLMLTPHHDDALLSIPEFLLGAASKDPGGTRLVVVFSDEDPALEHVCETLHRQLGLSTLLLGFPEARKRGLSVRQIFRSRRDTDDSGGDPLAADIRARLRGVCAGATTVLAPLTGIHIDHALVRDAARHNAFEQGTELVFYADEPYATIWPAAGERARRGLQAVQLAAGPAASTRVRSLLAPLAPFVGERDLGRLHAARELRNGYAAPLWRAASSAGEEAVA